MLTLAFTLSLLLPTTSPEELGIDIQFPSYLRFEEQDMGPAYIYGLKDTETSTVAIFTIGEAPDESTLGQLMNTRLPKSSVKELSRKKMNGGVLVELAMKAKKGHRMLMFKRADGLRYISLTAIYPKSERGFWLPRIVMVAKSASFRALPPPAEAAWIDRLSNKTLTRRWSGARHTIYLCRDGRFKTSDSDSFSVPYTTSGGGVSQKGSANSLSIEKKYGRWSIRDATETSATLFLTKNDGSAGTYDLTRRRTSKRVRINDRPTDMQHFSCN